MTKKLFYHRRFEFSFQGNRSSPKFVEELKRYSFVFVYCFKFMPFSITSLLRAFLPDFITGNFEYKRGIEDSEAFYVELKALNSAAFK